MSPNQFRIVVGSYEHNILCLSLDLSLETPVFTPVFHFQAHALSVKCLAIAGRYLVSGSNDEHIRIYDLQKRKELGTLLAHQGSITALQFSRRDAATAGNARWLLSASEDHRIIVWRVRDWENLGVLKGHTARVNDLDIHPSGRIAVSVSEDHSVRLWNLMTVKKAAVLKLRKYNQNGQAVRWLKRGDAESADSGSHFAVALLTKVIVFAAADAKVHREIDLGRRTVMHIEVQTLPDGREYLCVGLSDGRVEFYDSEKLCSAGEDDEKPVECEFHVLGHTNRVKDFAFYTNEHGTYLVSIGSDGKAVVWEMAADGEPQQRAVYDCGERLNCLALCDEAVEKVDTMKKRLADGDDDERDLGEQSEPEDEDAAKLQRAMFGKRKRAKRGKGKGKSHVSVEL